MLDSQVPDRTAYTHQEITDIIEGYKLMSDDELLQILIDFEKIHGRLPNKADIPGAGHFKTRFGPWNRILERAGLKPPSLAHKARVERRKQKNIEARRRRAEYRAENKKHKNSEI